MDAFRNSERYIHDAAFRNSGAVRPEDLASEPTRVFLDDGDVRLYQGDVTDVLAGMPDESVDCVVTSPPYWGLRDYGTGLWDGGGPDCDHVEQYTDPTKRPASGGVGNTSAERSAELAEQQPNAGAGGRKLYRETCGKCGARRVDQQLGLEPTPDLYVERIVAVFREVRRVLAPHGTCWVNLGDSYANVPRGDISSQDDRPRQDGAFTVPSLEQRNERGMRHDKRIAGLKQKDLCGIPWRVAFALQQDGWWLRADIIWAKPNPMPESVTDRPTKAHEYVFLLTKAPRYYFDQEAVREAHSPDGRKDTTVIGGNGSIQHRDGERWPNSGRNVRSVWQIATQPYPEAHFATYPEELVRRCVLAGCPTEVCLDCGFVLGTSYNESDEVEHQTVRRVRGDDRAAEDVDSDAFLRADLFESVGCQEPSIHAGLRDGSEGIQVVEETGPSKRIEARIHHGTSLCDGRVPGEDVGERRDSPSHQRSEGRQPSGESRSDATTEARPLAEASGEADPVPPLRRGDHHVGTCPSCGGRTRPGRVLDPFAGSGTTAKVARDHGRHSIGIDLSADYLNLAARRLQQLSLLT